MITSWIRRKSLKKPTKGRFLASDSAMSPVMLLSIVGSMIVIGVFAVGYTIASQRKAPVSAPEQLR